MWKLLSVRMRGLDSWGAPRRSRKMDHICLPSWTNGEQTENSHWRARAFRFEQIAFLKYLWLNTLAQFNLVGFFSLSNDDGNVNDNAAKNRFNEQKQSLCTCVLHFGTFLCRPLQNNVKWPNLRFCGERQRTTVNFPFSFLTCTPLLPIWFLDRWSFL